MALAASLFIDMTLAGDVVLLEPVVLKATLTFDVIRVINRKSH